MPTDVSLEDIIHNGWQDVSDDASPSIAMFGDYRYNEKLNFLPNEQRGVQDLVSTWIANEVNPDIPMINPEAIQPIANAVSAGAATKPTRLARFFNNLFATMKETGILDSGATGSFLKEGVGIPTGKPSGKVVSMPNGIVERASQQILLPNVKLKESARKGDELPGLQNNLISVPILANNGYTTIFKPDDEAVEVYHSADVKILAKNEPILRGWRDSSGLWRIPLVDDTALTNT